MKRLLFILLLVCFINPVWSQVDSLFANYYGEYCTYTYGAGTPSDNIDSIFIYSDNPYTDTLRMYNQFGYKMADLWLDTNKIWVKLADLTWSEYQYWYYEGIYDLSYFPIDTFFVLYDFGPLDTAVVGDEIATNITVYDIDSIELNGTQHVLYTIAGNGIPEDKWIKGIGSMFNPLKPLFSVTGIVNHCGCGMNLSYFDGNTIEHLEIRDTSFSTYVGVCSILDLDFHSNISLNIYPNPTKDKIVLKTSEYNQLDKIIISDIFGKVVQSEVLINQGMNEMQLDLSHLSNGIYLVHVWIRDSALKTMKIIKN